MTKILQVGLLLLMMHPLLGQERSVTGKVTDATDGTSLPGVSILVKGTNRGTVSTSDGNYTVNVTTSDVLVFSFIGFETQEVTVGQQSIINLSMNASTRQLSEIVVIGYGEREKKDLTGAISTMDSKEIVKSTAMNPQLAMQGKMAGVFVSTPSGNPFDRPTVRIRGVSTWNYADPLYVIDGIPLYEGAQSSPNAGNQDIRSPLNVMATINPNDIESISVLKDASAAAIYGVRASNGVILITTKKGAAGKAKIDLNATTSFQNVANNYKMLNTPDYVSFWQEAYANNPALAASIPVQLQAANPAFLGNSPTYKWQDQLLNKNAPIQDYSIRVSGGSDKSTYSVSAGYGKTEGTLVGNSLSRYTLSTNVVSKVNQYIETGMKVNLSYNEADDRTGADLSYVATAPPWQPIFDVNDPSGFTQSATATFTPNASFDPTLLNPGTLFNISNVNLIYGPGTRSNVFANQNLNSNSYTLLRTLGNVYLQIEPLKGLKIRGTYSADYQFNLRKNWNLYDTWRFSQTPGNPFSGHDGTARGSYGERQSRNLNQVSEVTVNYNKSLGNHNLDFLVAAQKQNFLWEFTDASSGQVNSTDPDLRIVRNNPPYNGTFTGFTPRALLGYLARASYNYNGKYYLDATIRRDGASTFAPGFRWGTFPSFSAAWRLSQEAFWQNLNLSFVNDLKFRGGWGEIGNMETTQGFSFLSTVSLSPDYSLGSGLGDPYGAQIGASALPNFPNFDLTWERVRTTNFGFDALLLNNSVSFTAEYYSRFTKGVIQGVQLPPNTGIQGSTELNLGDVRNTGIEIQLGYNKTFGDFGFNASGNFTTVKNRVTRTFNGLPIGAAGGRVEEGFPIGYIFGYQVGGIFQNAQQVADWKAANTDGLGANNQQPGDIYFLDNKGNPVPGEVYNFTPDNIVNPNDRTYLGKTIPGFYYGLTLGGTYKGFDVSIFFQGVGDVQKFNSARATGESMSSTTTPNQWTSVNNRWTGENTSTTMPRAVVGDPNSNNRFSNRFVENASFMRLRNVQIGYSIPRTLLAKTKAVERIRLFVGGTNLFTITEWDGIDPENDFFPISRQWTFGLNANF